MPQGQYPTILAGQAYTAGLIQGFAPLGAWKTSDTSRASTVTLTSDPDLTLNVVANAFYKFKCYLDFEAVAGTGFGIQWQWAVPAGSTLRYHLVCNSTSATPVVANTLQATDIGSSAGNGPGSLQGAEMTGTLFTSTLAGAITLQWAQATSSATATIVHAQSFMELGRLA